MLCEYGCGLEAKFQFKNGKWCCSNHYSKCPIYKEQYSQRSKGRIPWNKNQSKCYSEETIQKMKDSHIGKKDTEETKLKKKISAIGRIHTFESKRKISLSHRGIRLQKSTKAKLSNYMKNMWNDKDSIYNNDEWKNKNRQSKRTIYKIKNSYQIFSKEEEMRYNPDKPDEKEIQVHCKNSNCPNSKEQNGWFTPNRRQIELRITSLEKDYGNDGCYFYCSQECKNECILYNLKSDPFKEEIKKTYTDSEYNIWKQIVLEHDNYECQKCGSKENLNCHHIAPVKTHPHMSLDPDNGIVLCQDCHYEIGHKTGTECSTGNLANKNC